MDNSSYIKSILLDFMWSQPHAESVNGMIAAGHMILHRVHAGWQEGNWIKVIQDAPLFAGNELPLTTEHGDHRDPVFQKLMWRVDSVYSGTEKDPIAGALFGVNLNLPIREWFQKTVLEDLTAHPRVASVGQVTYFK